VLSLSHGRHRSRPITKPFSMSEIEWQHRKTPGFSEKQICIIPLYSDRADDGTRLAVKVDIWNLVYANGECVVVHARAAFAKDGHEGYHYCGWKNSADCQLGDSDMRAAYQPTTDTTTAEESERRHWILELWDMLINQYKSVQAESLQLPIYPRTPSCELRVHPHRVSRGSF
jgi:hypothetical protein